MGTVWGCIHILTSPTARIYQRAMDDIHRNMNSPKQKPFKKSGCLQHACPSHPHKEAIILFV